MKKKSSGSFNLNELASSISEEIQKSEILVNPPSDELRLKSYWNIGKIIHSKIKSLDLNEETITQIYDKVSKKLSVAVRSIYYSVRFHEYYPVYSKIPVQLNWSMIKVLASVPSPDLRSEIEGLILTGNYSARSLGELLKKNKEDLTEFIHSNLTLSDGIPFHYSVIQRSGKQCLDLGFKTYLYDYQKELSGFTPDSIVRVESRKSDYQFIQADISKEAIYTYKAFIDEVIDGDTLKVSIDLGFKVVVSQIVRLYKIDCPEVFSEPGLKARKYVMKKLSKLDFVCIKTYKKDKYSRYLADLFYLPDMDSKTSLDDIIKNGVYLNQELIDEGLANKYYIR